MLLGIIGTGPQQIKVQLVESSALKDVVRAGGGCAKLESTR